MSTTQRSIRLTDRQVSSLEILAESLNISGQRGARLNALISWLADVSAGALSETALLLGMAGQVATGGDLAELLEFARPPDKSEMETEMETRQYTYRVTFYDADGSIRVVKVNARHEFEAVQLAGAVNRVVLSVVNLDI